MNRFRFLLGAWTLLAVLTACGGQASRHGLPRRQQHPQPQHKPPRRQQRWRSQPARQQPRLPERA